jgi:hypothetical protein
LASEEDDWIIEQQQRQWQSDPNLDALSQYFCMSTIFHYCTSGVVCSDAEL